jgi:hypothetical protein
LQTSNFVFVNKNLTKKALQIHSCLPSLKILEQKIARKLYKSQSIILATHNANDKTPMTKG